MINAKPVDQRSNRWWWPVLRGALLIVLGVVSFAYPLATLVAAGIYIGLALIVSGVLLSAHALNRRHTVSYWGVFLAGGLFEAIVGLMLFLSPGLAAVSLPLALGFWAIVLGITQTINAIDLRPESGSNWGLNLIAGVAAIILGLLVFANFSIGVVATTTLIGTSLIVLGAASTYVGFLMRSMPNHPRVTAETPPSRLTRPSDRDRAA
ncbi:MAG: HdeD family acid-resistance protein [Candidatus Sericytochromatia bacterium]|nr:HdeD family acid-resistance protein [Candidatus Sericytochromatia bacterium]